jgi:2-phospho-L-lactate transferase/gluconeogenesis factor (CofD/UPF0052 family)
MTMKTAVSPSSERVCAASSHQLKIVLFCGGRGSATIIHELLRWPSIELTLIVNAYDDGKSTGALRGCIAQMLGPSDFRKNLSYLLDPYSKEQYALKHLLEMRLPQSILEHEIAEIKAFIQTETPTPFTAQMSALFCQIGPVLSARLRHFLQIFFNYTHEVGLQFDYRDCSMGNLIFAGAYFEKNCNFNAATKEMSQLVSSMATLVNVSQGENRILVGLKEDGALLATEEQVVGPQSDSPIRALFLVKEAIVDSEWQALRDKTLEEKEAWLRGHDVLPDISFEAEKALAEADIILFGPGTQHSSLFPSYRVVQSQLKKSPALVKAFIMNLQPDQDIQALSTSDIVDAALTYMGDKDNKSKVITHILLSTTCLLNKEKLLKSSYKQCVVLHDAFANDCNEKVHNGHAVIDKTLAVWEKTVAANNASTDGVSIFVDIHQRSLALTELYDEIVEIDWKHHFSQVNLTINQTPIDGLKGTDVIEIKSADRRGNFPEIGYFFEWLQHEKSEYLMLLTGDGKYRFRDVMLAIKLLEQSHFGAVFGSRNQSRIQFQTSLRAAYGEKRMLSTVSFLGSFLISAIFALRFRLLFSDPLTGFRLFKRSKIAHLEKIIVEQNITTSINLATYLIKNQVEIAELPVNYRTFAGFVDPHWRLRRGVKNLFSIFTRHA